MERNGREEGEKGYITGREQAKNRERNGREQREKGKEQGE